MCAKAIKEHKYCSCKTKRVVHSILINILYFLIRYVKESKTKIIYETSIDSILIWMSFPLLIFNQHLHQSHKKRVMRGPRKIGNSVLLVQILRCLILYIDISSCYTTVHNNDHRIFVQIRISFVIFFLTIFIFFYKNLHKRIFN